MLKTCFSFILFYFLINVLVAQEKDISFKHISVDQGLSQSTVSCIIQDRKGFMWFGTRRGLNKYYGSGFTIFKFNPYDSSSISNNGILSLFEDKAGIIWVGTNFGLNKYNPATNSFQRYYNKKDDKQSLVSNYIRSINEDKSGKLWIGTNKGIDLFDRKKEIFIHYKNNALQNVNISTIFIDSKPGMPN